MRTAALVLMLILPAVAVAYHYGPGQQRLALDDAAIHVRRAEAAVKAENFANALKDYEAALSRVPAERVDLNRQIRLEMAKARMSAKQLPEAYDELLALKDEVDAASASVSPSYQTDLRKTIANAQYYMTWLMRLEGEPREQWEPDIEAARQNYKLLAEAAHATGNTAEAEKLEGDLEASIRLARMDLSELQALALPKQCQGCCSGNCKGKCKGKGRKPNAGQNKPEDARGASSGPPPDEKGS